MIQLNSKLQPLDSIPARQTYVPGVEFEQQFEPQGRYAKFTQVAQDQLVLFSGTATGSGQIGAGTHVIVTTTISPNQVYKEQNIGGDPMLAIYEGTAAVGSMLMYPGIGAGIAAGKFTISAGYDYSSWLNAGTPAALPWTVAIYNTAGTTADIFIISRWKYSANNAGKAA